jgi:hypothetical protein
MELGLEMVRKMVRGRKAIGESRVCLSLESVRAWSLSESGVYPSLESIRVWSLSEFEVCLSLKSRWPEKRRIPDSIYAVLARVRGMPRCATIQPSVDVEMLARAFRALNRLTLNIAFFFRLSGGLAHTAVITVFDVQLAR